MKFTGYDKDLDLKNPSKNPLNHFTKRSKRWLIVMGLAGLGFLGLETTDNNNNSEISKVVEQTEEDELENAAINFIGDSEENIGGLRYYIHKDLDYISKTGERIYPLAEDDEYPKLILSIQGEDTDYIEKNIDEKWIEEYIVSEVSIEDKDEIKCKKVSRDNIECFKLSYDLEDDEEIFSSQSYIIPTYKGLYTVNLLTYEDDDADYKYTDFIDDLELSELLDTTKLKKDEELKKVQEEKLNTYRSTITAVFVVEGANDQEKEIFESRKQDALKAVEDKKSDEEINSAINLLKQTNTDIQTRLDQEKAAQEEAQRLQFEAEQQAQQEALTRQAAISTYILNGNTGKFHVPTCRDVSRMAEHNKVYKEATRDEIIAMGYSPCQHCWP